MAMVMWLVMEQVSSTGMVFEPVLKGDGTIEGDSVGGSVDDDGGDGH